MIRSLSELSLARFIDLACGNNNVLLEEGEEYDSQQLASVASDLIYRYRSIVSPSSVRADLYNREDILKLRLRIMLGRILKAMCGIGDEDAVKSLLQEMAERVPDNDLEGKINRMCLEAEFQLRRRMEEVTTPSSDPESVRESFDNEIAFINTYFKMCIDTGVVSAGVYANMVHRADIEIQSRKRRVK